MVHLQDAAVAPCHLFAAVPTQYKAEEAQSIGSKTPHLILHQAFRAATRFPTLRHSRPPTGRSGSPACAEFARDGCDSEFQAAHDAMHCSWRLPPAAAARPAQLASCCPAVQTEWSISLLLTRQPVLSLRNCCCILRAIVIDAARRPRARVGSAQWPDTWQP